MGGTLMIDWIYFRTSWNSCKKVQEFLDTHTLKPVSRTDARKEKLDAVEAWNLMHNAKRIFVAKGKRVETFVPTKESRESILKAVIGRSGSLRAPTVQSGDVFLVGFNETLYEKEAPFFAFLGL